MKRLRFNKEQIIGILREQEAGARTAECRRHQIGRAIFRPWKVTFGGLDVSPAAYAKLGVPAMQREGTLRSLGGSALHPVAPPSQTGSNEEQTLLIPG